MISLLLRLLGVLRHFKSHLLLVIPMMTIVVGILALSHEFNTRDAMIADLQREKLSLQFAVNQYQRVISLNAQSHAAMLRHNQLLQQQLNRSAKYSTGQVNEILERRVTADPDGALRWLEQSIDSLYFKSPMQP